MKWERRLAAVAGSLVTVVAGGQLFASPALADDPQPQLHNVTYRARVDGVSRGAEITFAAQDNQTQTATPTMLPGREFEADTVLPATAQATMRVSIQWPYSANLSCEILVDDTVVAQAEHFIAPRALPVRDDPDYGALTCEAPVSGVPNNAPPADNPAPDAAPAPPN